MRKILLVGAALSGCTGYDYVQIHESFDIDAEARAALADDGVVVAASADALFVGDGTAAASTIDLAALDLEITASNAHRPVQVRDTGDLVLVADRGAVMGCGGGGRGAYALTTSGGPATTLVEHCDGPGARVGPNIAMNASGTVAVSDIVNGAGAVQRGPVAGPLAVLRSGTGEFYNTSGIDIAADGRVAVHMEYFDGFAGGLMRGTLAFDTPEQAKADIDTAVEKLGIGSQPPHAIAPDGLVAFSMNSSFTLDIGGTMYPFVAGVYVANPTQFNTPKDLELVADHTGPYCRFGAVDIADGGAVVFEAELDAGSNCGTPFWDGLFTGADPDADVVVARGDADLGAHQYFDGVRLGEINAAGQIAFVTTYSEPLVAPIFVWRADPS